MVRSHRPIFRAGKVKESLGRPEMYTCPDVGRSHLKERPSLRELQLCDPPQTSRGSSGNGLCSIPEHADQMEASKAVKIFILLIIHEVGWSISDSGR